MGEKEFFHVLDDQKSTSPQYIFFKKIENISSLFIIGLFIVVLVSAGYVAYDYRKRLKSAAEMNAIKGRIASQQEKISEQRDKIQTLTAKINALNIEMSTLKEHEAQVRNSTVNQAAKNGNLKKTGYDGEYISMGGPLPEDIHTDIDLKEKNNQLIDEMHSHVDRLKLASIDQGQEIIDLRQELEEKQKKADCTPSILPVQGRTTSRFGYRRSAFTKKREYHKGHDIGAPRGTPIVATADGMVKFSGRNGGYGKMIVIDHGYEYITRYAHASKLLKKKGDRVKRGDLIALVGNTGRSTGPHVHYEVRKKGVAINPKEYFSN